MPRDRLYLPLRVRMRSDGGSRKGYMGMGVFVQLQLLSGEWRDLILESCYLGEGDSTSAELAGIRRMVVLSQAIARCCTSGLELVLQALVRAE